MLKLMTSTHFLLKLICVAVIVFGDSPSARTLQLRKLESVVSSFLLCRFVNKFYKLAQAAALRKLINSDKLLIFWV